MFNPYSGLWGFCRLYCADLWHQKNAILVIATLFTQKGYLTRMQRGVAGESIVTCQFHKGSLLSTEKLG